MTVPCVEFRRSENANRFMFYSFGLVAARYRNTGDINSIQINSDICTRQLMNITLAHTAKKAIDNNKVHE